MYIHVTCSQSLNVHNARQISVYEVLCPTLSERLSVPLCILCMHNLYMYMSVIPCLNRCTDIFYNCVILFAIMFFEQVS